MPKIVLNGSKARNALIAGADKLSELVRSTLGPFGTNVFLEKGHRITNDGVSIAKEVELDDEIENKGAYVLREASTKTNEEVGDGTTTAIVLAQAIVKEAVRLLPDKEKGILANKKTGIEVINQIEKEKNEVIEKLMAMAKPIKTEEELIQSAKVSVEDDNLGEIIGKAQWELGKDGILIAEETAERFCSVENVHGLQIDNGFGTSMLINNQEKGTLEVEDTQIILTDHTIHSMQPLERILQDIVNLKANSVTIIARAFTPEVVQYCMQNTNTLGGLKIYPINAPYTGQTDIMKDLEAILGGTFYHFEARNLEDIVVSDLGFASKIIAKRFSAIITGQDNPDIQTRVLNRIEDLSKQLESEVSEFEKRNLEKRIAQLKNGFSIVKIGANSENERKYLKDKADDAVNAVRCAFQEGVVAGGGLAFKQIADELPDTYILKKPLCSIYEQIMSTAPAGWEVSEEVKDPVKVLRVALERACSVAGTLATASGAIVSKKPETRYMVEAKQEE